MKYFFKRWDTPTRYNLLVLLPQLAEAHTNTQFHIWNCGEFEWVEYEEAMVDNLSFHHALKANNNWVTHWVGRYPLSSAPLYNFSSIPNHVEIYHPTYWIEETLRLNKGLTVDPSTFTIDKLFMSLNGAGRYHRRKLLERIISTGLFQAGYISWYGPTYKGSQSESISAHMSYINPAPHSFDPDVHLFVLPSQMTNNQHHIQHYQHQLPSEYTKTLMSVVTESTTEQFFLTEKTAVAILYGKPILVLGCQYFHQTLRDEFGFRLYDSFDYSFDSMSSEDDRIQGILHNLHALKNQNYQDLHDVILSDIRYNQNRLVELLSEPRWAITKKSWKKIKKGLTFFEPVL